MTGRYQPTVTINGTAIPPSLGGNLVALSGVEIVWGRDGVLDPNEPGQATIDVLDEVGDWVSDPTLYQAPVIIETSVGRCFRGYIDRIEISSHVRTTPQGEQLRVWMAHLSASDTLAVIARTTPAGIHTTAEAGPPQIRQFGPDYWGRGTPAMAAGRWNNLKTRIAEVSGCGLYPGPMDNYPASRSVVVMPEQPAGEDLYTMLQRWYATTAFQPVTVKYHPDEHRLYPNFLATAGTLVLAYASSQITVKASGATSRSVPANTVEVDEAASITSTISNNVTSVAGQDWAWDGEYETWGSGTYPTANSGTDKLYVLSGVTTGVGRTSYDTKAQFLKNKSDGSTVCTVSDLFGALKSYLTALNGKFYAPPLTFDLEAFNYGSTIEAALLAGVDVGYSGVDGPPGEFAWAFPGAIFEALTGWGPFFQMVGAVMTYNDGWRITGKFAPTTGAASAGIAINALVVSATPTFDQYAPNITLSTLGTVSGGI